MLPAPISSAHTHGGLLPPVSPIANLVVLRRETSLHPGLYATAERLGVAVAASDRARCLTGSRGFSGSGAIENDFLTLWQGRRHGLESGEWDRTFEPPLTALRIILVAAHEKRLASRDFLACGRNVDTFYVVCHVHTSKAAPSVLEGRQQVAYLTFATDAHQLAPLDSRPSSAPPDLSFSRGCVHATSLLLSRSDAWLGCG
jgi:hypothetical protein